MDAYRIIEKPENHKITITLPESFGDEEVEVIVLPVNDKKKIEKESFDPDKFRGIWKNSNIDAEKLSREMRSEWNRNI